MSLTARLTELATNLISQLGYGGLALGLIVDSAGVPIPSEILLPLSGALARQGRFSLIGVIVVGTLAQTAGAALAYGIGATGGLAMVERYGKYVLFSSRELATTHKWFDRYGSWLALSGRVIPVIRTYIGYAAGVARMPFGRFLVASLIGSAAWSVILAALGYQLAGRLDAIDAVLRKFSIVVVVLLVIGVIWYVRKHWKAK